MEARMRTRTAIRLFLLTMAAANSLRAQPVAAACMSAWPQQAPACLDQNWTNQMRDKYWFMDQGSKLMPIEWFQKLEKAGSTDHFADGLERYGFVKDTFKLPGSINSAGLPLGVAVSKSNGDSPAFVGLTCSACHSGMIAYQGKSFMIEGAPSMLDFDRFLADLVDAMT